MAKTPVQRSRTNYSLDKRILRPVKPKSPSKGHKRATVTTPAAWHRRLLLLATEALGLSVIGLSCIFILIGYLAGRFTGTQFFKSLLPFASGILALMLVASIFSFGWIKLRKWMQDKAIFLPALISVALAVVVVGWFATHYGFTPYFAKFRTLLGGRQEVRRVTLAHQVYAAYRRQDQEQLRRLVIKGQNYNDPINDAAAAFNIDAQLLQGVAATESSFSPRESNDGGRGLFQITKVPEPATSTAAKRLGVEKISLVDAKHNAFVAAATLSYYLKEMRGDLFLGLLAYNIGPANGGLGFIMQKYDATDFVTIQPYLQKLPSDYPIRVLAYALAFRIYRETGNLLAYESGDNATRIQKLGIPGIQSD